MEKRLRYQPCLCGTRDLTLLGIETALWCDPTPCTGEMLHQHALSHTQQMKGTWEAADTGIGGLLPFPQMSAEHWGRYALISVYWVKDRSGLSHTQAHTHSRAWE